MVSFNFSPQCGTEPAVALIGKDIIDNMDQYPRAPIAPAVINIYIAAPCYQFPGYAGLNLPFKSHHHLFNDQHEVRSTIPMVIIYSSPCNLK